MTDLPPPSDATPPQDHEDFVRVRNFGLAGVKKYLDARRKSPPSDAAPVAWRYQQKRHDPISGPWRVTASKTKISSLVQHAVKIQDVATSLYRIEPLYAHPEDAPAFLHPCSFCGLTGNCSAHTRTHADPTCKTCFGEHAKQVEDAPGGPWFVEHKDGCLQPAVFREAPFRVAFTGTQKECNAVRDALNCSKDAPGEATVKQIAAILCPGYAHTLRGLMTDEERDTGKACARCHVWAIGIRDALNRLKGVEK